MRNRPEKYNNEVAEVAKESLRVFVSRQPIFPVPEKDFISGRGYVNMSGVQFARRARRT